MEFVECDEFKSFLKHLSKKYKCLLKDYKVWLKVLSNDETFKTQVKRNLELEYTFYRLKKFNFFNIIYAVSHN